MMCFDPSELLDDNTTDGEEYAFDVTQVQCATKADSSKITLPITTTRGKMPKIPFVLADVGMKLEMTESIESFVEDADIAAFFAFLEDVFDSVAELLAPFVASRAASFRFWVAVPNVSSGSVGSM